MNEPLKIALISDVPPDSNYTGGQVLKLIIDNTPDLKIDFFWLNQSNLTSTFSDTEQIRTVFQTNYSLGLQLLRVESFLLKFVVIGKNFKNAIRTFLKLIKAIQIGLLISKKINKNSYDYVWFVQQGEYLAITYFVSIRLIKYKYIFQQWDPISWWCSHRGHGKIWSIFFESLVKNIERNAFLNLVPSYNWKDLLNRKKFPVHRIDNFLCEQERLISPPEKSGKNDEIQCVFVGQFYSNNELSRLVSIVALWAKERNYKLFIHYFGAGTPNFCDPQISIINHGFVSKSALINTIGQWDFALLPYPTEKKFDLASKYSFPSKSRIYVAASLPILSYAKIDSSPHQFYQKEYADHYQNAMEQEDLTKFIVNALDKSEKNRIKRYNDSKNLIDKYFSKAAELETLHAILKKKLGN